MCNTNNALILWIKDLSLERICENKFGEKKQTTNIWWLELCTFYPLFQAVLNLTRELRFVENEFHFLKEPQDRKQMGYSLKSLSYLTRKQIWKKKHSVQMYAI